MSEANKIIVMVQARMGSKRLPGKSLALIWNKPMIQHVLERSSEIPGIDEVVCIIPQGEEDRRLKYFLKTHKFKVFCGAKENVLHRFVLASRRFKADVIVRITGDCPFLDPIVSGQVLAEFLQNGKVWYAHNTRPGVDGLDTEVFTRNALLTTREGIVDDTDREHVTTFFRKWLPPELILHVQTPWIANPERFKLSVDTKEDLLIARMIGGYLHKGQTSFLSTYEASQAVAGKDFYDG